MTFEVAEKFVKDAGLQTCEIIAMDPATLRLNRAVAGLSIAIAKDCTDYDPSNPTVVNVHQFADLHARDAMLASLENLRFRAIRAYADIYVVEDLLVVLLGPQREELGEMLKAEYRRRHPDAG